MDVDKLAIDLLLKGMTKEQQNAALDSIKESVTQAKAIQKQRIGENVQVVVQALKKLEADIKARYDETGRAIEKRVASIKDGKDGQNGVNGKDGRDGRPGRDGASGQKGNDGLPGRNGIDGVDGVSVTNAFIDFDGSLIINLSNGQDLNVGEVVAPDLAEKIKVITNGGGTSQQVLDTLISLQTQINNLIPSQTGNAGKFLTTNGSVLSWDNVAGGLDYQGTWNASTNTPTLASGVGVNGYYYITATAGSTNLDGITDWEIGDWLLFNGTVWQKIDQSNLVTSVNGQTGAVSLTTTNINEGTNLYYTDARARAAISAGTGISYDSATGVVTNASPDQTVSLTGAGTTSISGTYPNFTITSADSTVGTVTSVSGTGTVSGISLSGTVTSSGNLTLGGTLDLSSPPTIGNTTPNTGRFTTLTVDDNITLGSSNTDTVTFNARINSDFEPATDNAYDLGRTGHEWRNLYIDGTANIDSLIADTADINAGTIDNTSIGASTASTGAFTTLSATGVTTVQAGTVSAPAITTSGDTNTGIFFPAADTIAFAEGGAEAMRITDAGNVGIGTSFNNVLDQVGGARPLLVQSGSASTTVAGSTNAVTICNSNTTTNNSSQLNFAAITGASANQYSTAVISSIHGARTNTEYPSGTLVFSVAGGSNTAPTERMRIDSAGNVGIGTSSPTRALTVVGTWTNTGDYLMDSGSPQLAWSSGDLRFKYGGLGGTEAARIDSSGNLLIGATSPVASERLNVTRGGSALRVIHVENTRNVSGDEVYRSKLGSNCDNTSSYHFIASTGANDRLYMYGNGNIQNANGSYGTLSDIKLKENIVDATPKLDKLMQVRVVNYNLKTDPELKQLGVVAQELEQVFPGLVDEHADKDAEGNDLGTTTKSVKTSVFVPMLIKAMQEMKAVIDSQAERIAALEAK